MSLFHIAIALAAVAVLCYFRWYEARRVALVSELWEQRNQDANDSMTGARWIGQLCALASAVVFALAVLP